MLCLVKLSVYLSSLSKHHDKSFARNSLNSISSQCDRQIQEIKYVFMNLVQNKVSCDIINNVAATNSSSVRCQIKAEYLLKLLCKTGHPKLEFLKCDVMVMDSC